MSVIDNETQLMSGIQEVSAGAAGKSTALMIWGIWGWLPLVSKGGDRALIPDKRLLDRQKTETSKFAETKH